MNCPDSFWLWFVRPFAEALGALALVAVVLAVIVLPVWWRNRPRKGK